MLVVFPWWAVIETCIGLAWIGLIFVVNVYVKVEENQIHYYWSHCLVLFHDGDPMYSFNFA